MTLLLLLLTLLKKRATYLSLCICHFTASLVKLKKKVTVISECILEAFKLLRPGGSCGSHPFTPQLRNLSTRGRGREINARINDLDSTSFLLWVSMAGDRVSSRGPLPGLRVLGPRTGPGPLARGRGNRAEEERGGGQKGAPRGGPGRATEDAGFGLGAEVAPRSCARGPSPRGRRSRGGGGGSGGVGGGRGGEGGAGGGLHTAALSLEPPELGAENFSPPAPGTPGDPRLPHLVPTRLRPASSRAAPIARRAARLQRRENEPGGDGAARSHLGGGDRGRPRHHVGRPRPSRRGPGPSRASGSPLAS